MSVTVAKARSMSASGARAVSARFDLSEGFEIVSGIQACLALPEYSGNFRFRGHSATGLTSCRLDPVVNDPGRVKTQ